MFTIHLRLGRVVIQDFTKLRMDSQAKNIAAWTPVVAETLQGFVKFDDKAVSRFVISSRSSVFITIIYSSTDTFRSSIRWQLTSCQERWLPK